MRQGRTAILQFKRPILPIISAGEPVLFRWPLVAARKGRKRGRCGGKILPLMQKCDLGWGVCIRLPAIPLALRHLPRLLTLPVPQPLVYALLTFLCFVSLCRVGSHRIVLCQRNKFLCAAGKIIFMEQRDFSLQISVWV